jgi:hypothetical protein
MSKDKTSNAAQSGHSIRDEIMATRYWEHFIRNEDDFAPHLDYIHWNPVKNGLARCAAEWPYSTFHRFVPSASIPAIGALPKARMVMGILANKDGMMLSGLLAVCNE